MEGGRERGKEEGMKGWQAEKEKEIGGERERIMERGKKWRSGRRGGNEIGVEGGNEGEKEWAEREGRGKWKEEGRDEGRRECETGGCKTEMEEAGRHAEEEVG